MITVAIGQSYDGPLDLLLALVRREGYPMDRLPVAEITRQYLSYLRGAPETGTNIDVEEGAEFFETASWLTLLKSRALLPRAAGELPGELPDHDAPEQELARTLLDHEALRSAARGLRERLDGAGLAPGTGPAIGPAIGPGIGPEIGSGSHAERWAEAVGGAQAAPAATLAAALAAAPAEKPAGREQGAAPTVQDVLLAARRALEQARAHAQGSTIAESDPYPIEALYQVLEERLAALEPGRGVSTEEWFIALPDAQARCALLLALLELARLGRVLLAQWEPLQPVLLKRMH